MSLAIIVSLLMIILAYVTTNTTLKIMLTQRGFEGRDNVCRRPEMGPRPGPATPTPGAVGALTFQD